MAIAIKKGVNTSKELSSLLDISLSGTQKRIFTLKKQGLIKSFKIAGGITIYERTEREYLVNKELDEDEEKKRSHRIMDAFIALPPRQTENRSYTFRGL